MRRGPVLYLNRTDVVRVCLVAALVLVGGASPALATYVDHHCSGRYDPDFLARQGATIEADCPCFEAADRASYLDCARASIQRRIDSGDLSANCDRLAMTYARKSVCGRSGAKVCCRSTDDGTPAHRIVRSPSDCRDTPTMHTCLSNWPSTLTGCDDFGCVPHECGNGILEEYEECEDPESETCSYKCTILDCFDVPATCGDAVVSRFEDCEPPGIGNCSRDCKTATCQPPGAGETRIACVEGLTRASIAGGESGYLVAWTGDHRRSGEILAAKFDANLQRPDEAALVLSTKRYCEYPYPTIEPAAVASGPDFYVAWEDRGDMYGRRIRGGADLDRANVLQEGMYIGSYPDRLDGPFSMAPVPPSSFLVLWNFTIYAFGWNDDDGGFGFYPYIQSTSGAVLDASDSPLAGGVWNWWDFEAPRPPDQVYVGGSATLGDDTLTTRFVDDTADTSYGQIPFTVAGYWNLEATVQQFSQPLASTTQMTDGGLPAVAAGTSAFAVVWGQGATDDAAARTEIRAIRVTRADGNLDAEEGILVATAASSVEAGPFVAFDGNRWFVVWTEAWGGTSELRGVAIDQDGTVVDSSPRSLASGVTDDVLSISSMGEGRVAVVFARDDGDKRSLEARLVTP